MAVPYSPVPRSDVAGAWRLLAAGALAGPIYLAIGLAQAALRPGFDLTRHDLSLLANGDFGWIQSANLAGCGLLVVGAALGVRRALDATALRNTRAPLLIAVYGLGMIGGGLFSADPALGFPLGTPADANTLSWHGLLHLVCGGLGFLGLIAACFVLGRRFAANRQHAMAGYSVLSGVVFLAGFVGIIVGSGQTWAVIGLWLGLLVAWVWLSSLCVRLLRSLPTESLSPGDARAEC